MRRHTTALACALVLAVAGTAHGHNPPRMATRELVRIQGHRTTAVTSAVKRRLVLMTLGVEQPFGATDWQVFGFADTPPAAEPPPSAQPQRFELQGDRAMLTRFAAMRPEQTVTVLAEHRPGSTELFLLTLDACPP